MRVEEIEDGWIKFMEGEREVLRMKPPPPGGLAGLRKLTDADRAAFIRILERVASQTEFGPS